MPREGGNKEGRKLGREEKKLGRIKEQRNKGNRKKEVKSGGSKLLHSTTLQLLTGKELL